jgi:hypothetical protein
MLMRERLFKLTFEYEFEKAVKALDTVKAVSEELYRHWPSPGSLSELAADWFFEVNLLISQQQPAPALSQLQTFLNPHLPSLTSPDFMFSGLPTTGIMKLESQLA